MLHHHRSSSSASPVAGEVTDSLGSSSSSTTVVQHLPKLDMLKRSENNYILWKHQLDKLLASWLLLTVSSEVLPHLIRLTTVARHKEFVTDNLIIQANVTSHGVASKDDGGVLLLDACRVQSKKLEMILKILLIRLLIPHQHMFLGSLLIWFQLMEGTLVSRLYMSLTMILYVGWKKATYEKYDALLRNKTWSLVELPAYRKIVSSKWIFRLKKNTDGIVARCKARLVANDYLQRASHDFHETFILIVKPATV
ncbi:hypothetical protein F3Y22_tig00007387pilonHSYRG00031 [Hibiscus syriacus]|uniref:Reverse transcriptase Ty1/copia-type domain-containing protein n=1 Tax=Hibiscus syriacus TaxID=106335 RepID=A0A6A3CAC5_HIBSY|nr:hypothetical protein F3Y22_tig00007387pilonHSYRG00031 [Hibiscus syriacus]